jgi:hypothetical protein
LAFFGVDLALIGFADESPAVVSLRRETSNRVLAQRNFLSLKSRRSRRLEGRIRSIQPQAALEKHRASFDYSPDPGDRAACSG